MVLFFILTKKGFIRLAEAQGVINILRSLGQRRNLMESKMFKHKKVDLQRNKCLSMLAKEIKVIIFF